MLFNDVCVREAKADIQWKTYRLNSVYRFYALAAKVTKNNSFFHIWRVTSCF